MSQVCSYSSPSGNAFSQHSYDVGPNQASPVHNCVISSCLDVGRQRDYATVTQSLNCLTPSDPSLAQSGKETKNKPFDGTKWQRGSETETNRKALDPERISPLLQMQIYRFCPNNDFTRQDTQRWRQSLSFLFLGYVRAPQLRDNSGDWTTGYERFD